MNPLFQTHPCRAYVMGAPDELPGEVEDRINRIPKTSASTTKTFCSIIEWAGGCSAPGVERGGGRDVDNVSETSHRRGFVNGKGRVGKPKWSGTEPWLLTVSNPLCDLSSFVGFLMGPTNPPMIW